MRSLRLVLWTLLTCLVFAFQPIALARDDTYGRPLGTIGLAALPIEARTTLELIRNGGPFPYRKDGSVFQNREQRLPFRPRGYYREYTVPTPGATDRGARRIIAGERQEYFYTSDHYRSFRRIQP